MDNTPSSVVDLDNTDLTSVDTSRPLLEPGSYEFEVAKLEKTRNKSETGDNLSLELHLKSTAKSTKGNVLNPGFPVFHTFSLVATEKYDPRTQLAAFQEAVLGHKENFGPLDKYLGKTLSCKVKVESSEAYGDQTRIQRFIAKK